MNNIETMKMALEALETNNKAWKSLADSGDAGWWEAEEQPFYEISVKAITALRQAIEQAQQAEPFGYFQFDLRLDAWVQNRHSDKGVAFYTSPPNRQPLTDEELEEMAEAHVTDCYFDTLKYARAIEAAHGIKVEA